MVEKMQGIGPLLDKEAYRKILYWFFSYPSKGVSLNELADNLEISKTSAKRIVENLIEEGFLKREILGKTWRIICDEEHSYNRALKIPYNLSIIYGSGIVEHIKKEFPNAKAIVLFGSYRKGDDTEDSDIDIAVEVIDNIDSQIREIGVLEELGYRTKVPVHLYLFSRKNIDLNLFNNIANGIVLDGFLEVQP